MLNLLTVKLSSVFFLVAGSSKGFAPFCFPRVSGQFFPSSFSWIYQRAEGESGLKLKASNLLCHEAQPGHGVIRGQIRGKKICSPGITGFTWIAQGSPHSWSRCCYPVMTNRALSSWSTRSPRRRKSKTIFYYDIFVDRGDSCYLSRGWPGPVKIPCEGHWRNWINKEVYVPTCPWPELLPQ